MPGKPFFDEPAIDGPASMKAKARMKLTVRIRCLRVRLPALSAVSLLV